MPRKASKRKRSKPALGEPRKGKRFDAEKRAKLLTFIEEGASAKQACRLTPIAEKTLYEWLKGNHAEHAKFTSAFREAEVKGIHEIHKLLAQHAKSDYRAAVEVLRVRDDRFGERLLRRRRLELENERMVEEGRLAKSRADLAEALVEKAKKGNETLAFGLAMLLSDERISEAARRELADYAVKTGIVIVERLDLAGGG